MNRLYRYAENSPFIRFAALVLAAAPAFMHGTVNAQPDDTQAEPRKRSLWLEPRITVQETLTSNARLDARNISDQITEVSPGFRLVSNTAHLRGFVDYSLRSIHYAQEASANQLLHSLNASMLVEAVEQRVFIDVAGVIASQPISVFGPPVNDSPANPNASQTSSYRLSPYLRGRLGTVADYEARYSVQDTRTDTVNRSGVTTQDWLLHLGSSRRGQMLGWAADASQQTNDFSLGRRIDTTTLRGSLSYAVTPQLALLVLGGAESTNQLSPTRESHSIAGFGVNWQPSERTRLSLSRERRYFGGAHNVALEHRTGRTVWRYTDVKGISNGLGTTSASLGSLFDLLDGFYVQQEPDPVLRTQLVLAEIARLGLPANLQVFPDFLRSSSTVRRVQQLSLALLGRRSAVTLAVVQTENRLLDGSLQLGDDFNANSRILQRGWNLSLAHRLTPNSSIVSGLSEQRSVGTAPGLETRVRSLTLGFNTLLTYRTSGGLQVRRVLSDGLAIPYRESAIIGTITHRF